MYTPTLSSNDEAKPRVFLSYAREDYDQACRLCKDLAALGADPWLDKESLLPGQEWEEAIERAIQSADFFVALLSANSVGKRGYVQKEVRKAIRVLDEIPPDKVYLIPARLGECKPRHARLRGLNWIDLFPNWKHGVKRIGLSMDLRARFQEPKASRPTDSPSAKPVRMSLALTPASLERLEKLRSGVKARTHTDVLRRALSIYELLMEREQKGGEFILREGNEEFKIVSK